MGKNYWEGYSDIPPTGNDSVLLKGPPDLGGMYFGKGEDGKLTFLGFEMPDGSVLSLSAMSDAMSARSNGGAGGGAGGGGGENKIKISKDIDYPVRRRQASMSDIYKPKVQKTFKDGGLVRGCGAAQRGKTRGKMV